MVKIGHYNQLQVVACTDQGAVLADGNNNRLLLPLRECPKALAPGATIKVFIYLDAQGYPVPTTQQPTAELGQVGWLEIADVTALGAFARWGISKDLFIPFAEQHCPLQPGMHTLVVIYQDNQGRLAGSTRIDHWINDISCGLSAREKVTLIIAEKTALGYKAIINHTYWGLLYDNELYKTINKGQVLDGYIKRIRDDGKVDLALTQPGFSIDKIDSVASAILSALQKHGGFLPLTDKSPPEDIYAAFEVSKKVFKQAMGRLYKQRRIALESTGTRLIQ